MCILSSIISLAVLYYRVDPDSPLHSDLQVLKEKEGVDYILLNFSYKVSPVIIFVSWCFGERGRVFSRLKFHFPSSDRIIFLLTHLLYGLSHLCSPEGECAVISQCSVCIWIHLRKVFTHWDLVQSCCAHNLEMDLGLYWELTQNSHKCEVPTLNVLNLILCLQMLLWCALFAKLISDPLMNCFMLAGAEWTWIYVTAV